MKKTFRNRQIEIIRHHAEEAGYLAEEFMLYSKLCAESSWKNARTVALTISTEFEIDTKPLISLAWADKKKVVVPKTFPGRKMEFFEIVPESEYELTSFDMNTPLFKGFDINVYSAKDTSIKCCAIAYYSNNKTKSITKQFNIQKEVQQKIDFSNFQNLFTYNISNGYPVKIEYIVYPYNGESYKWIINYRGE